MSSSGGRKRVSKLEDEAAAFKRAKEAEKKRRQRSGKHVLSVEVHLPSLARMLLAEGLLKEEEIEDVAAISAATAAHLRKHERAGRILSDQTPHLGSERQEVDSWVHDRERPGWKEEYEAKRKKLDRRLTEQGPGPERYNGPHVSYDDPSLPHPERRGKGGRNGRNPGFLDSLTIYNARGVKLGKLEHSPVRQSGKRIKQLTPAQVRAEEKKIEKKHGPLTPPDTGVHTEASSKGEVDAKLDKEEWREMGYAERVVNQQPGNGGDDWS
jgi:hypothetical protein